MASFIREAAMSANASPLAVSLAEMPRENDRFWVHETFTRFPAALRQAAAVPSTEAATPLRPSLVGEERWVATLPSIAGAEALVGSHRRGDRRQDRSEFDLAQHAPPTARLNGALAVRGSADAKAKQDSTIMTKISTQTETPAETEETILTIPLAKVCALVAKAHEFDAKDPATEDDPGSNPSDDNDIEILEEHADDPVEEEIAEFVGGLSEDEQIDLVALVWLGRDDYAAADWGEVRIEARRAHNDRTAEYLLGTPLLGDFLEEGLSKLGYSCAGI
jgi:hypothetical protein